SPFSNQQPSKPQRTQTEYKEEFFFFSKRLLCLESFSLCFSSVSSVVKICVGFQDSCISNPSRSFGSNHVDFGGMIASASDTAISSSTLTGCIENATAALPLSTS